MDDRTTEAALSLTKFGVGQPVRRSEDPKLVRGEGRYTDDIGRTGQTYAVMVRSSIAHGVIRGIDTAAAKAMPGVLAVYTAADLTGYGPQMQPAAQEPRRFADPLHAAAGAGGPTKCASSAIRSPA